MLKIQNITIYIFGLYSRLSIEGVCVSLYINMKENVFFLRIKGNQECTYFGTAG